jgi:hypothetical protein
VETPAKDSSAQDTEVIQDIEPITVGRFTATSVTTFNDQIVSLSGTLDLDGVKIGGLSVEIDEPGLYFETRRAVRVSFSEEAKTEYFADLKEAFLRIEQKGFTPKNKRFLNSDDVGPNDIPF